VLYAGEINDHSGRGTGEEPVELRPELRGANEVEHPGQNNQDGRALPTNLDVHPLIVIRAVSPREEDFLGVR
jgi:hypothetical protein